MKSLQQRIRLTNRCIGIFGQANTPAQRVVHVAFRHSHITLSTTDTKTSNIIGDRPWTSRGWRARFTPTHERVLGGLVVDRGRRRKADALGRRNAGDGHIVDFHVDLDLRQKNKDNDCSWRS